MGKFAKYRGNLDTQAYPVAYRGLDKCKSSHIRQAIPDDNDQTFHLEGERALVPLELEALKNETLFLQVEQDGAYLSIVIDAAVQASGKGIWEEYQRDPTFLTNLICISIHRNSGRRR